jgi:hypothetical protein
MVPWQKLPRDLQRALLAIVVLSGEAAAASSCAAPTPMICDPVPPPAITRAPTMTPMICDPAPPPTITRTPTMTPMICDPAPPPTASPTPTMTPASTFTPMICDPAPPPSGKPAMTPASTLMPMICDPPPAPDLSPRSEPTVKVALPGFEARNSQVIPGRVQEGIEVRGTVKDRQGNPVRQVKITLTAPGVEITSRTSSTGIYALRFTAPGSYRMFIGVDRSHSVPLDLKLHDLAIVEWAEAAPGSQAPLPLAEIRTVRIAQIAAASPSAHGLTFAAASPWPGAAYRWTVSGGTLVTSGPRVSWQPPAEPGRYLLQVVADWDFAGLAVDAVVLAVAADGRVTVA